MPVTFAVQFEVSPFQQDGQVLGLLYFHDEDAFPDRMQEARRHVYNVARSHLNAVEQREERVDVLAHHQRLQVINGHVSLQTEVNLTTIDDVAGLGFAMRPVEVHCRKRGVRMGMYREALSGVQEFDK